MSYWVLQSTFEPRTALHRISVLLNQSADELCVEFGLSHHHDWVHEGWNPDRSPDLLHKMKEIRLRDELESDLRNLRDGKSALRFLGEERVVAKQQKIKSELTELLTRHDLIRWYYQHPRIWLLSYLRDAALDASRSSEADWIEVEENDESLSPTTSLLLKSEESVVKVYAPFFQNEWNKLSPEFILYQLDGHRSLTFDSSNKIVSFCESIPSPVIEK